MGFGVEVRSELRNSDREALSKRVLQRGFGRYLQAINLVNLRAYTDAQIRFDFPVTALVGANGAGKTTVLGAAALPYIEVQPRLYFAKSGAYDSSMQNWRVEYELVDDRRNLVKRTASYRQERWNREAVERPVRIFGVTRTVPATERKDLSRAVGRQFRGFGEAPLSPEAVKHVKSILDKDAESYVLVDTVRSGSNKNQIYAAREAQGINYSEFHFGAGEASVIRIVRDIEEAPDGSLILIEEIENGLHPVATRRLVEYLIEVARRKSCQIIFTTHSNDALAPLPDEAVWACAKGKITQGKLDVAALRALTGRVEASFAFFVEDTFAEKMATVALRTYAKTTNVELPGIEIYGVAGEANVESFTRSHNKNPSTPFGAAGIFDGDMREKVDTENGLVAFPGDADPEAHIIQRVEDRIEAIAPRLALNLGLPSSDQGRVIEVTRSVMRTNKDPHLLFAQIGDQLDFLGEGVVINAYLTQWAQNYPEEVAAIFEPLLDRLPRRQAEPEPSDAPSS
ncbi:AAA family ATPase [Curtobacterium sp. BRB10]|uniref:ATP-dependent nuclease n=1 Tax=Curtobacterium sp. BRB10 TaxID=2962579 RepID=UPI00288273DA|nr:AAA family ATPase [Curtobacterium sp. BRB10]MDT0234889.1 AAA family ATPase [Curtobacterium sp. BRB10]